MVTHLEFTVDTDDFPLAWVFEASPDARVELERIVPTDGSVVSYFWIRDGSAAPDICVSPDEPGVLGREYVDVVDGDHLFKVSWDHDHEGLLTGLDQTGVTLLDGTGTADGWVFEVRGERREDIAQLHDYCRDRDISLRVDGIHELRETAVEYGLTDAQREALVRAYEMGHFDTPRTASLEAVAEDLGISRQALASRLRRGHRHMIENALVTA
jgi:hypothetical protein